MLSPLFTTFKMVHMTEKSHQQTSENNNELLLDDSDNDSGVDVSNKFVDKKHFRKRRRTTNSKNCSVSVSNTHSNTSMQDIQHVDTSMIHDTPTSTLVTAFDLVSTSNFKINNWVEHSLLDLENQSFDNQNQCQWPTPCVAPTFADESWCNLAVVPPICSSVNNVSLVNSKKRRRPVTINLDNEEIANKYLHFEDDEEDSHSFSYNISSTMPTHNMYNNANNNTHFNLYPHSFLNPANKLENTTFPMNIIPPPFPSSLHNSHQLQQFVTMQDILYS